MEKNDILYNEMVIARMRKMREEAEKRNTTVDFCKIQGLSIFCSEIVSAFGVFTLKTETILLLICVRYGNKHCLTGGVN